MKLVWYSSFRLRKSESKKLPLSHGSRQDPFMETADADGAAARMVTAVEEGDEEEEFEPLFNYTHVQPVDLLAFGDDAFDSSPIFAGGKRKGTTDAFEGQLKRAHDAAVVILDDDEYENCKEGDNQLLLPSSRVLNSALVLERNRNKDEDWLPPPPPRLPNPRSQLQESKTLEELRLYKQELASFAQSTEDLLQQVVEAAKLEHKDSEKAMELSEPLKPQIQRQKIVICIQDKEGQKQFRVYSDDKFERLFKLYAEKVQMKLDNLTFSFDGEKISLNATPEMLGLENDDIIEVHTKSK